MFFQISAALDGPAELVVCDGAPDVTGLHDMDEYVQARRVVLFVCCGGADSSLQAQLVLAALNVACLLLKEGGCFVAKIFRGKEIGLLYDQLSVFFSDVQAVKPRSSRASSLEAFVVCRGFRKSAAPKDMMIDAGMGFPYSHRPLSGKELLTVPYVACGDLCGFDSDTSYVTEDASLPPVAPPLSAGYLKALQMRKQQ